LNHRMQKYCKWTHCSSENRSHMH